MAGDVGQTKPPLTADGRWFADAVHKAEQFVYVAIAAMLILALVLALGGAALHVVEGLKDWTNATVTFDIIDRLLFVLMLVEILHTVQASLRTSTILCEPFLIVGLIACIRRVLVITLETSQLTQPDHWTIERAPLFHAAMLELGVLSVLIAVLIGSIWLMRASERGAVSAH